MKLLIPLLLFCSAYAAAADSTGKFVRVSTRDHHYLEFTDGSPYIPIGLNMIAPPNANAPEEEALRGMEAWLASLSSNGGNYIRVWLSSPFWDVEHEKSGVYDSARVRRIERLLELCAKYGIRVKFTMEHLRSIGGGSQKWADKPMHIVSEGGPAASINDFFDGAKSREQFIQKMEWYSQRFKDNPTIYGWELWNEINAIRGGDYMSWTAAMLPELHRLFTRNMAMQSLGSFDTAGVRDVYRRHSTLPGNDVAQVHRYLDLGASLEVCKGPVDVLAADAVRELRGYQPDRPVILAESGAVEPKHSGPFLLYRQDREGTLLHDILFAPFFAGAAGPGQIWHWDSYVAANQLWYHFGRFAEAVHGIDPVAEAFEPSRIEHDRVRVYVLRGRKTVLAWLRDSNNSWEPELKNGIKPETLTGLMVNLGIEGREARVYDPWSNAWVTRKVNTGTVTLPDFTRSIVVRAER